jgi:hypothetical protein
VTSGPGAWARRVAALLLLAGCPPWTPSPKALPGASGGLKLAMPDGWTVEPRGRALAVGPEGRWVALLEVRDAPAPAPTALVAAVAAQGGSDVVAVPGAEAALTYQLAGQPAFLAVRRLGQVTVWCSSLARATGGEVKEGLQLCQKAQWATSPGP